MKYIIDGSNVQWEGNRKNPNFNQLISLCLALYKNGHEFVAYIDANTRHQYPEPIKGAVTKELDFLLRKYGNLFVECPGKESGDQFILNHSNHDGLPIISNDQYRKEESDFPFVKDKSRLLKFAVVANEQINIPALKIRGHIRKSDIDYRELCGLFSSIQCYISDSTGYYWSTQLNSNSRVLCDRHEPNFWEIFKIFYWDDEYKFCSILGVNLKYVVSGFDRKGQLFADRLVPSEWEKFEVLNSKKGWISLKASNGKFISCRRDSGRNLLAIADEIDEWEIFKIKRV